MIILGIESSCDETGIALVESDSSRNLKLLSNTIASSLALHASTGGIIPEVAAREQMKYILPVLQEALTPLGKNLAQALSRIDAIAVTSGPGLIGSLLVGLETARTLSYLSQKPLIPVNHLYGHIYANFIGIKSKVKSQKSKINDDALTSDLPTDRQGIRLPTIQFPALALVISGGHTDLVLLKNHDDIQVIGATRDDAAGEAFDKIGRLLGFPYPAGPILARLAENGDKKAFPLPRPMIGSADFDFSFSGLKTAVLNLIKKNNWNFTDASFAEKNQQLRSDICASVQYAIVDVVSKKTIRAAKKFEVNSILLGGGVAANTQLQTTIQQMANDYLPMTKFFVPPKELCTDNGAMIAAAAFFQNNQTPWNSLVSDPELYY